MLLKVIIFHHSHCAHWCIYLVLAQVLKSCYVGNQALAFDTICEHFQWTTPMQWINLELRHINFPKSVFSLVLHWHSSIICWTYQCDNCHGCLVWSFANFSSFSYLCIFITSFINWQLLSIEETVFIIIIQLHYELLHGTKFPVSLPLQINLYTK
jgi:hypothetical protein